MIEVSADNLWATVTSADRQELEWLAGYLSVPQKGAEQTDAFKDGRWDGMIRLFDKRHQRFASGLLRLVVQAGRDDGVRVQIHDARVKPDVPIDPGFGAWLRPYQQEVLEAVLKRGRGIVSAPTGAGKSVIFSALVGAVPVRWLILVDTKDLMHQAADHIEKRLGEPCGRVGDSEWSTGTVTVATLQTLCLGMGDKGRVDALLESAEGIIADEVQVLSAHEFNKVAFACPNAWWRIGLSATALERMDEMDFMAVAALGPLIIDIPARRLIDEGWLAEPLITMHEFEHDRMTGTFAEVYEAGVVLSPGRNELVVRLACDVDASPRPTLVFFRTLSHGRALLKKIEPHASADMVNGASKTTSRKHARVKLMTGRLDVLLTSKIFNKGIDIPEVESAVNAAAGASLTDAIQKVGRGLRIPEGTDKRTFLYHDILDTGNRMLEGHARQRIEAYRSRGYKIKTVR